MKYAVLASLILAAGGGGAVMAATCGPVGYPMAFAWGVGMGVVCIRCCFNDEKTI